MDDDRSRVKFRPGRPEEVGMDPERLAHVRGLCGRWVENDDTPSLVVFAARRGVVVLHEAFGHLRPEPGSPPLERDSIFPVMSASKPVTAAAIMCLVEDGLLGLNRSILDYVPELDGQSVAYLDEVRVGDRSAISADTTIWSWRRTASRTARSSSISRAR